MQFKFWAIRLVLGIVLGFGAVFVVEVLFLAMVVWHYGSLDASLSVNRKPTEADLDFLASFAMLGAVSASFFASVLSVMSAPTTFSNRFILRGWAIAACIAVISGGGIGVAVSLLHPRYINLEMVAVLTLISAGLIGAGVAILLRLGGYR